MDEIVFEGVVDSEVFYNETSHYGVYRVASVELNDRPITVVGTFYQLELDSYYEFSGFYVENPRFGMQFQVSSYIKKLPIKDEFVVRYLSGSSFPGIGPKTAQLIVNHCGADVLEVMRKDQAVQFEVPGVSKEKMLSILNVILTQNAAESAVQFLSTHGISGKTIQTILGVYGDETETKLLMNPYRMVDEVSGVGFQTADKLGKSLGFDDEHPYRAEGYLIDYLKSYTFNPGHSFVDKQTFLDSLPAASSLLFESAYHRLVAKGIFVEDEQRLYHYTQIDAEVRVADFLLSRTDDIRFSLTNIDSSITRIERRMGISFDKTQKDAIRMVFKSPIVIITGGPGTGKSTLLSGLISIIQDELKSVNVTLCAPTGRAAKRLESLTHVTASTIHSVLKWNLHTNVFGMSEMNPLETDIIVVDEFSMVDVWLLSKLFEASENVQKFVFVGDRNQLPSVGPGYVLGDLMSSGVFPIIELEHNYRQAQGSEVIDLAMQVNEGVFDVSSYGKDVRYFDAKYGNPKDIVIKVVREALDKGYSMHDIQVLSPRYNGVVGIDNLNYFLQKTCNPESMSKKSIQVGSRVFREGDKILQLKNQPDDGVFNGDIGTLVEIEEDNTIIVDFEGVIVEYDKSNYINISHAYAMSVHKAQGSEYPIVVLLASRDFGQMLSRKLYYTAITRSSKSVILVGDLSAFERAALNNHEIKRNTYLAQRLKDQAN